MTIGDLGTGGLARSFRLDLVVVLMAYLLLYCGTNVTVLFAFTQGFVVDTYSAGHVGLFSLLYLLVFWILALGSKFFDFNSLSGKILFLLSAEIGKYVLFIIFLEIFHLGRDLTSSSLLRLAVSAWVTALAGPLIFSFLGTLRLFVQKKATRRNYREETY